MSCSAGRPVDRPRGGAASPGQAREFLDAAQASRELGLDNAATSDAVISAINSKDAIRLTLTGRTGKSENHAQAVRVETVRRGRRRAGVDSESVTHPQDPVAIRVPVRVGRRRGQSRRGGHQDAHDRRRCRPGSLSCRRGNGNPASQGRCIPCLSGFGGWWRVARERRSIPAHVSKLNPGLARPSRSCGRILVSVLPHVPPIRPLLVDFSERRRTPMNAEQSGFEEAHALKAGTTLYGPVRARASRCRLERPLGTQNCAEVSAGPSSVSVHWEQSG